MAKQEKKIPVNALERMVKEQKKDAVVSVQWGDIEIKIKQMLDLKEMLSFVRDVSASCFATDTNEYMPEVLDFAFRCGVLERYANFTLPSNIETRYKYVYGCDAYSVVVACVDLEQLNLIRDAIDERIDAAVQANIDAIHAQIHGLSDALDDMERRLEGLFDGVSQDDIRNMVGAISGMNLDEEKLMKTYLDQRYGANSTSEEV